MKTIGFVRSVVIGPRDDRVKVDATTILNMPDDHASAVKEMTPTACDLTPARLHQAMFGEPFVPRSILR